MTEPSTKKPAPPAAAARLLITAGALSATLIGWALLALETKALAAAAPPQTAPAPPELFPPLPRLAGDVAPAVRSPRSIPGLRQVTRPPPPPVAATRSSR